MTNPQIRFDHIEGSNLFFEPSFNFFDKHGNELQPHQMQIYLSTHLETMKTYADFVMKAIQPLSMQCHPLETGDARDDERWLRQESNGFIAIVGARYGDVKPDRNMSRQHYEYTIARDKWQPKRKYVAVFKPSRDSKLFNDLSEKSRQWMRKNWLSDDDIHADFNRLTNFIQEIHQDQRTLEWQGLSQTFENEYELFFATQQTCKLWQAAPEDVARGDIILKGQLTGCVANAVLGRLYSDVFDALEKLQKKVRLQPKVPLLLALVSGTQNAAYAELAEALVADDDLFKGRALGQARGVLPEKCTLPLFMDWFKRTLRLNLEMDAPELFAAAVYTNLRQQSINLLVDGVERYEGDLPSFYTDFWQPFIKALNKIHLQNPLPSRNKLTVILVNHGEAQPDWQAVTQTKVETPEDYQCILLLPPLAQITEQHLRDWMEDNADDLPVTDVAGVEAVIARVLQPIALSANETLEPDTQHIFERLRLDKTWQEKEEIDG